MFDNLIQSVKSLVGGSTAGGARERRRLVRLKSHTRVNCVSGEHAFAGLVTDMGLEGMRLQADMGLRRGTEVLVRYAGRLSGFDRDTVRCRVIWCRPSRFDPSTKSIGLKFEDSSEDLQRSWIKPALRDLGFHEKNIYQRRKQLRVPGAVPVSVRSSHDEFIMQGLVVDLGMGGAMLDLQTQIQRGTPLLLQMGPLEGLPVFKLSAQVLSLRKNLQRQSYIHQVRFLNLERKEAGHLESYIVHLIKGSFV